MVMKKKMLLACSIGMMLFVLTACGTKTQSVEQAKAGEESVTEQAKAGEESVTEQTESTVQEFVKKEEADVWGSYEEQYGEVLDKYYAALSEKWDGQKLSSEGLSQLSLYCQEGNALENVGYAFLDVNGDGVCELMIGAIHGDEFVNKMLFELYTLEDGVPVQIFAGQERDSYYIVGLEEGGYLIANEASSGAANSAWFYYAIDGKELSVVQAILYDAAASPDQPWYMTYSKDWDISSAEPVKEQFAEDLIESYKDKYMVPEYQRFSDYRE